ncbi:hypothetical protein H0H93_008826 [Arthromyces matolae]|nr:hypothetical protein H0H93_008826 [Arthromyces matolae]
MHANSAAENALATLGTVCWSGQLLPQIWKSWRDKSTDGLSPFLVLLWGLAGLPLGAYNIIQRLSIPLICQPQLFAFLSLFAWGQVCTDYSDVICLSKLQNSLQCLYYGKNKSALAAALIAASVMLIIGGLEAGIVFAIRPSMNQPAIFFLGVLTSVMIAGGLIPQYWEIFKRREVIGISVPFIVIDWLGAIFALVSLLLRPKFDIMAGVAYSLVIVMDGVIILAAMILNPLARKRRSPELEERLDSMQTVVEVCKEHK